MASFLSSSELSRIKSLAISSGGARGGAAAGKSTRKKKSYTRAKNWPNSLANARTTKLKKRQAKFDKIEEQQRKIDAEEEEYEQSQRQAMIQRAKDMMIAQKSHVKPFANTMMLAEAMKSNQVLIEYKKKRAKAARETEAEYHKFMIEGAKRQKQREDRERREALQRSLEFTKIQKRQLAEVRRREEIQRREEWEAGQRALAVARQVKAEAEAAEAARVVEIARLNRVKVEENKELAAYKARLKAEEQAEIDKIEDYARMKDALKAKRKADEVERKRKKQEIRQRIIDEQVRRLDEWRVQQRELKAKQDNQAESRRIEWERQKAERIRTIMAECDRSRKQQMRAKKQRKDAEREHDRKLAEHTTRRIAEITETERKEREDLRRQALEMHKYHKQQVANLKARRAAEKEQRMEDYRRMTAKYEQEDQEIREHIEKLKVTNERRGLDPYPLRRLMEKTNMVKKPNQDNIQSSWPGPL